MLTDREKQFLSLITRTDKDIASLLGIERKTLEKHKGTLSKKLGAHCKAEIVVKALRHQVITLKEFDL